MPASAGITDNVSPARRVAFSITDSSSNDLTDAGNQLFVNSILWAAGRVESSRADLGQVAGSTGALTAPALVDFGDLSGDATYEFSFNAIKAGASTADVEYSIDLINWEVIAPGVSGALEETDGGSIAARTGFYRAKQ